MLYNRLNEECRFMLKKRFFTLFTFCLVLVLLLSPSLLFGASDQIQEGEMAGYLGVPH